MLKSIPKLIINNKGIKASNYEGYNSKNLQSKSQDPFFGRKYTFFIEKETPKGSCRLSMWDSKELPKG